MGFATIDADRPLPVSSSLTAVLDGEEPGFLVNCTTPQAHHDVTVTALRRGVSVLSEKPMSVSLDEARSMVSAADEARRLVAVNQNRRFMPGLNQLGEFLAYKARRAGVAFVQVDPAYTSQMCAQRLPTGQRGVDIRQHAQRARRGKRLSASRAGQPDRSARRKPMHRREERAGRRRGGSGRLGGRSRNRHCGREEQGRQARAQTSSKGRIHDFSRQFGGP
ncbi:Gfo/Idh/MocA family oxidoreductase [Nonomuraea sp. 3N208]|uniref:Gfo/Idh/MocA family oxidoreductase n=1 Tax=Nonomuraea sp. 3N208 TaxID=3457421 RepID=UPI003FD5DE32